MSRFKKLIKLCFAPVILWAAASHSAAQLEPRVYEATPGLKAFSAAKLAYLSGAYTEEADLLKLVNYYAFYDAPYEGAKLLEAELEKGRIRKTVGIYRQLSNLYRQSREDELAEKALSVAVDLNGGKKFDTASVLGSYSSIGHMIDNGQCDEIEKLIKAREMSLNQKAKFYMFLGSCFYEKATEENPKTVYRETCNGGLEKLDWWHSLQKARSAFEWVPFQTKQKINAKKWVKFIDEEMQSSENKCALVRKKHPDPYCSTKTTSDAAHDIFTGKYEAEYEKRCSHLYYKPEYDRAHQLSDK